MSEIRNDTCGIEVRQSVGKGRGVFALKDFSPGEVIEIAPYLWLGPRDHKTVCETDLVQFVYEAGQGAAALGLGFASLYNHSDKANADFKVNERPKVIKITAVAAIAAGREITINYGYHPADPSTWSEGYTDYMSRAKRKKR